MRCGKCKQLDVTIDHVRECYFARPDAEVAVAENEGTVPRRGENFFVTASQQRLYDTAEEDNKYWANSKTQYAKEEQEADDRVARGKVDFSVGSQRTAAPKQTRQADSQPPVKPASEKQLKFIADLRERKGKEPLAFTGTSRQASEEITRLQGLPNVQRSPAYKHEEPKVDIEDGIYRYKGDIYKVIHAVHGSGFQYAKRLVKTFHPDDHPKAGCPKGDFVEAKGIVFKLKAEMMLPLEEAVEFGKLYGFCVRCGKTLTREDSIERGMGSKCYGIMNGDF